MAKSDEKPRPTPRKRIDRYTISLRSGDGGEVELAVQCNLLEANDEDREFILGLVDTMRRYESGDQERSSITSIPATGS